MTRHKSRVARRRSARRGTRKQSGGGVLDWLLGKNPDSPGAAPAVAEPSAQPGFFSGILSIFKSKKPEPKVTSAADENTGSPPPAETQSLAPVQVGGRKKSRKTRHRRRRSPRHHRK